MVHWLDDEPAESASTRRQRQHEGPIRGAPRMGAHDWRPHVCGACGYPIWPGERHHRVPMVRPEVGMRRIHYGRCPGEPPEFSGPVDKVFVAIAWAFAAIILSALWFAVGYQW